ncbi:MULTISPECIES: bifunctional diguanylate cyclase/phosphodiesterase [Aliivibrio]|uniref:Diguanylate cyclase n=2 Tax=Aliivibrio logei TaxID=688 RepID=A0A1B9NVM5_ALILO|nr:MULTISPECIES: EAL domain-containing protein [Aliivibrio]MBB1313667.1 EAL domain-containing protein [Aliivibrio sp. SR45-2]OCH18641.1 diguanylate cyclase [Aliivibrio logei]
MIEQTPKRQFSLRTAVMLPFITVLSLTLGVIFYTQNSSYEKMVDDVSQKILSSYTQNTHDDLNKFLESPFFAVQNMVDQIERYKMYQPNNITHIQSYLEGTFLGLYQDLEQMDVLSFGGEKKEYIGFRREPNTGLSLMLQDKRTGDDLIIYRGKKESKDIRSVIKNYDPRERPWYIPAANTFRPSWSAIYANADERKDITMSAIQPVFYNDDFIGVFAADIKLDSFNRFLLKETKQTKGSIYLIDEQQQLIAHSSIGSVISLGTDKSQIGSRLYATESSDIAINQSAQYIKDHNLIHATTATPFNFTNNKERYFSQITPYVDDYGLHWYIVISISESDLLGQLQQEQRRGLGFGFLLAIAGLLIGIYFITQVTKPIFTTAKAARNIASGHWNNLEATGSIYETTMLMNAFNDMTNKLQSSFEAMRQQIIFDPLTQVFSRQGLIEHSKEMIQAGKKQGLLIIGVNNFRDINDSLGIIEGDKLLQSITDRLQLSFPEKDIAISRVGGDEFAVFFSQLDNVKQLEQHAIEIQARFITPFCSANDSVLVSISIGLVAGDLSSDSMTIWLRNASIALGQAKKNNFNISLYTPEMAEASLNKAIMTRELVLAIENNEMVPFYQPIIDIKTGKTIGAEALVRWLHPTRGMISPLDFIPLAEDNGMIIPIGKQILTQACLDTVSQIEKGLWSKDFHMHVNLSVCQLMQDDFLEELDSVLTQTTIPPQNLTLEITESRLVNHDKTTTDTMQKIRDLGIQIAIDDFGTGYSSLAYIHKLPFDVLKVDRSFIKDLTTENVESSIAAAVINMTKGFNITLVAEGIETQEQAELLVKLNYQHAQGFLYSRPLPLSEWPTE